MVNRNLSLDFHAKRARVVVLGTPIESQSNVFEMLVWKTQLWEADDGNFMHMIQMTQIAAQTAASMGEKQ